MNRKAHLFAALAAFIATLFVIATAQAAPSHPFLEALTLKGPNPPAETFNRACGTAVDSEGDVYVASAGSSRIDVFDPDHNHLKSIANANEPCALAVDSKGNLYVSETKTGNVVRYTPSAYPFVGAPTYAAPTAIDSSGQAKGIAVHPADDRLYVARGDHVLLYEPDGTPGIDEVQRIRVEPTNTTFTLTFEGQTTVPIAFDATHAQVQAALEALSTIGAGNVSVGQGQDLADPRDHAITFTGALGGQDLEQITGSPSGELVQGTEGQGFDGQIGNGVLNEATGVAAYTYGSGKGKPKDRYLFVADPDGANPDKVYVFGGTDVRYLALRQTIDGAGSGEPDETPDGGLGFGAAGAYLTVDSGTCPPLDQACTAGHLFVHDEAHEVIDEFEATGQYLTQVQSPEAPFSLQDALPSAIAIDRSGGPDDGTLYATSGAGTGAKALAFGPLAPPSRTPQPPLSFETKGACGTAVDSAGNIYVAGESAIRVYDPSGSELTAVTTKGKKPCDISVDSKGNVYAREAPAAGGSRVGLYSPEGGVFPPVKATKYSGPTTVEESPEQDGIRGNGVNPANDHLLIARKDFGNARVIERDSAANGSGLIREITTGVSDQPQDVAVHGASGRIYVSNHTPPTSTVMVINAAATEVLARIDGSGSSKGNFINLVLTSLAVDQSNGHVLLAAIEDRDKIEEYEASGTFVGQFGVFQHPGALVKSAVAVDNSGGPNSGNLYVAFDQPEPGSPDLWTFGPLNSGEPPIAVTGTVSGVGGGATTLNGTVNPRGFEVTECRFQYVDQAGFEAEGFAGAQVAPCAESAEAIGEGSSPVPVHADVSGLDPQGRYRFRLIAANDFGNSTGEAGLFGAPLLIAKAPQPISYTEATLRATIDPSGLKTTYRFQYTTEADLEANGYVNAKVTPEGEIAADAGSTDVTVPLFGLEEGATYRFRALAANDAAAIEGPDQALTTLARPGTQSCPNAALRGGASASLPDCRAYELVTPADTGGRLPEAVGGEIRFNNWLVTPHGPMAGNSVAFFIGGAALPGIGGNGRFDEYEARRGSEGWSSAVRSPSFAQIGGSPAEHLGVSADHAYSLWDFGGGEGGLPAGEYLGTPDGFEFIGQGSLGSDPDARTLYVSEGASHVIFSSKAHLEPNAPPAGIAAIYDRSPGGATHLVSLLPGEETPAGNASYQGISEDGTAIAFEIGGALYLRRDGAETVKVVDAPNTFAGVSSDGERVFYANALLLGISSDAPSGISEFDVDSGTSTQIAPASRFLNVSADGSRVYFTATARLDEAEEGIPGEINLYLWDDGSIRYVAILDPEDLQRFAGFEFLNHARWVSCIKPHETNSSARAACPSRSTPNGEILVFQSHANLTAYDSEGHSEIYRYQDSDESLICVSCDPSEAPPGADAYLQDTSEAAQIAGAPTDGSTLIPNVTDDGQAVFFETKGALLPEDANAVNDVYEWKAQGPGCTRPDGCLALISTGQGDRDSYLYSMTPDGHDVFFTTQERLLGSDLIGSPSIYDARVGGGFSEAEGEGVCEGDACQGQASAPPSLPGAASAGFSGPGPEAPNKPRARRCAKGKQRVVRRGKARCVRKHKSKQRQGKRHHDGRAAR